MFFTPFDIIAKKTEVTLLNLSQTIVFALFLMISDSKMEYM